MLRHDARAASENDPSEQRTDQRVADANPRGSDAVFPAELTGVADKDNGGEVRRTVSECGQPRADRAAAEDEAVDIGGLPASVQADANEHGEVHE